MRWRRRVWEGGLTEDAVLELGGLGRVRGGGKRHCSRRGGEDGLVGAGYGQDG